jgi:phage N-6-adenine-methyltransferase
VRRLLNALYSSDTDEWATPLAIFRQLDAEFGPFDLDPCARPETAKCARFYTPEQDGLSEPWAPARVFMNPPYSAVADWMRKARLEAQDGATVVCLVPARTDTAWWHDNVEGKAEVRFIRGRLKFHPLKHNAPFPSAVVVYRP